MASILLAYGTGEGQTAKVADQVVEVLAERGHEVTATNVDDVAPDLDVADFDAVVVGASIHGGAHQPAVRKFVSDHRDELDAMPDAFFQVSLSSADERGAEQAAGYVEDFVAETGWRPDLIGLFGGALRYSEYGFIKRTVMRAIAKRALPDADTSRDTEFTDWSEVEAFAVDVAALVEEQSGEAEIEGP